MNMGSDIARSRGNTCKTSQHIDRRKRMHSSSKWHVYLSYMSDKIAKCLICDRGKHFAVPITLALQFDNSRCVEAYGALRRIDPHPIGRYAPCIGCTNLDKMINAGDTDELQCWTTKDAADVNELQLCRELIIF